MSPGLRIVQAARSGTRDILQLIWSQRHRFLSLNAYFFQGQRALAALESHLSANTGFSSTRSMLSNLDLRKFLSHVLTVFQGLEN